MLVKFLFSALVCIWFALPALAQEPAKICNINFFVQGGRITSKSWSKGLPDEYRLSITTKTDHQPNEREYWERVRLEAAGHSPMFNSYCIVLGRGYQTNQPLKSYPSEKVLSGQCYLILAQKLQKQKKIRKSDVMELAFSFLYPSTQTSDCAGRPRMLLENEPPQIVFPFQAGKRVEYIFDECFNYTVKVTDLPKGTIKWEYFKE